MNNKYAILIHYETGDSLGTEEREDFLDGRWENEDVIRENICRIKEHFDWYANKNYMSGGYRSLNGFTETPEPEWHKGEYENTIILFTDDGTPYKQSAFWCGYFKTLYGAKAVKKEEEIGFDLRY